MSHLDSNQIPPRLSQILTYASYSTLVPQVNVNRLTDYVKITGTKYLFLDESSPFTQTFLTNQETAYINRGKIKTSFGLTHVFQTQWEPKDALMIDPRYTSALRHFPFTLDFSKPDGQVALDSNVHAFVTMLDKPENQRLTIHYPAQDRIAVTIPNDAPSNLIYIDESFDKEWKAFYNDTEQLIKPVGPNYMLVTLQEKGTGGQLLLKHSWPVSTYISLYFLIVIPILLFLHQIGQFLFYKIFVKEKRS